MNAPSEYFECVAFSNWLTQRGLLYCHVPNGGKRFDGEAAKLKRMGVIRGVPDYLIFSRTPCGQYAGVAVEMKRRDKKKSKISKEQKEWISNLKDEGWAAKICLGCKDAVEWCISLGL